MGLAAVTGARGLIGRYIVQCLLAKGWHVRVLSRQSGHLYNSPNVEVTCADITNLESLYQFVRGADAVFHCAAELRDESRMYDVNVLGTSNLIKAIQCTDSIKYFCHMSSAGVVGPVTIPMVDECFPCQPNNEYEKSKYEAEKLVFHAQWDGVRVCVLRPANVFDTQKPGITQLAIRDSFKDRLMIFFRGSEGAHLVHAVDVAMAALYFMDKKLPHPEVFFVSYDSDERNTVRGVYSYIRSLLSAPVSSFALPCVVPYLVRKARLGKSLHGRVRFSEAKLCAAGFVFPLGFEKALQSVVMPASCENV